MKIKGINPHTVLEKNSKFGKKKTEAAVSIRSTKKGGISKVKNILNTKVGKEEKKKIGIEARREFWLK